MIDSLSYINKGHIDCNNVVELLYRHVLEVLTWVPKLKL